MLGLMCVLRSFLNIIRLHEGGRLELVCVGSGHVLAAQAHHRQQPYLSDQVL